MRKGRVQLLEEWHEEVGKVYDQMVAWRRHLHENPELPFQEVQTARMVGDILAGYGIKVQRNVGGHGVVGILKGGSPGPTIALRADMDVLPIQQENDVPYKSQVPNVMHACGHDAHTATLLGVAKYFYTGSATEDPNTQLPHHHPRFNIDEQAMKNSAKGFLSIVHYYLVSEDA